MSILNARKGWAIPSSARSQSWNYSSGPSSVQVKANGHSTVDSGRRTDIVQLSVPPGPEVYAESHEMRDYRAHSPGQKEDLEAKVDREEVPC